MLRLLPRARVQQMVGRRLSLAVDHIEEHHTGRRRAFRSRVRRMRWRAAFRRRFWSCLSLALTLSGRLHTAAERAEEVRELRDRCANLKASYESQLYVLQARLDHAISLIPRGLPEVTREVGRRIGRGLGRVVRRVSRPFASLDPAFRGGVTGGATAVGALTLGALVARFFGL